MVSLELIARNGQTRGFSIRPFEGAFGLSARGAARKLLDSAMAWHKEHTTGEGTANATSLYDYPNPPAQQERQYSLRHLMKQLLRLSTYACAGNLLLRFYVWNDLNFGALLTSLLLVWGLTSFLLWPALRRGSKTTQKADAVRR